MASPSGLQLAFACIKHILLGNPQSHDQDCTCDNTLSTCLHNNTTSQVPLDAPPERWDDHVESDKQASNMDCEWLWWTLSFAIEENQKIKKAWRSMTNNRKSLPRNVAGFESVSPALHSPLVSQPVKLFDALQHQISWCFQDLLIVRS